MLKTMPWGAVYDDFCILQKLINSFFRNATPIIIVLSKTGWERKDLHFMLMHMVVAFESLTLASISLKICSKHVRNYFLKFFFSKLRQIRYESSPEPKKLGLSAWRLTKLSMRK